MKIIMDLLRSLKANSYKKIKVIAIGFVFFGIFIFIGKYTISSFEKESLLEIKTHFGKSGSIHPEELKSIRLISQEGPSYNNEKFAKFRREKFNFVVILTDDQRWDTIGDTGVNAEVRKQFDRPVMPEVEERLVDKGVLFANAFVTTPLCSAVRASMLARGFYAHNTGVLGNELHNGEAQKFQDRETLSTLHQNAGYKTSFIGNYMDGYPEIAPYIPPGWTKFVAITDIKNCFDFYVTIGGSEKEPNQGQIKCIKEFYPKKCPYGEKVSERYITNFLREQALNFIDKYGNSPFFLYFSTYAPNISVTPAPEYEELFQGYKYRSRASRDKILKDKPKWVKKETKRTRKQKKRFKELEKKKDEVNRTQMCTLQSVDRAIGAIIDKINTMGKLDQTVFIFTSDNGYMWGEHRLFRKNTLYEESIRVPFVIVVPDINPRIDDHFVLADLDMGTTIFDLASIDKKTDGLSLVPLLKNSDISWRKEFLIESFEAKRLSAGLRTEKWKYVEHATGEKELYDLINDPFERKSRHDDLACQDIIKELSSRLEPLKGLAITAFKAHKGKVCQCYEFKFTAWGGKKAYTWSIVEGGLPPGIYLDGSSGLISGIPKKKGNYKVSIKVEDSSLAKQIGRPQSYIQVFKIKIGRATKACLTHGPMVGAMTDSSAKIWFRVEPQANIQVEYAPDLEFDEGLKRSEIISTSADNDYTGTVTLTGLTANTTYHYRILVEGEDQTPTPQPQFKTFPKSSPARHNITTTVKIGVLTDFKTDAEKNARAIQALSVEDPDFVIILGDLDHRNPKKLKKMREMHRETRGDEKVAGAILRDYILYKFPVAYVWDDHDFAYNNSDKTFERKKESIQAYDEYWPSYERPNPQAGIWHKFKYGNIVEVFMLDLRSQRDLDTYKDPRYIPDNEPGANRDELRNDPCRSMLDGDACLADYEKGNPQPKGQKKWLKNSLKNSTAKWKIISSSVPWNPTTPKDDDWWDFKAEQEELLKFIRENKITGLIVISGDIHTGGAIDDGTHTYIPEMNVPTVNMVGPFCSLHNPQQKIGCGEWSHGFTSKRTGYGFITLTSTSALLEVKDQRGNTRCQLNLQ